MVFHAKDYFTEFTYSKGIFYAIVLLYTISCSIVVTLEPYLLPEYCHDKPERTTIDYPNPLYEMTPCKYRRLPQLLFLTPMECAFGRRLVMSVLLGEIQFVMSSDDVCESRVSLVDFWDQRMLSAGSALRSTIDDSRRKIYLCT